MRVVVQRVLRAEVRVRNEVVSIIGPGLLLYVGFRREDGERDLVWMAEKIPSLRIFEDKAGKMNCSALDMGSEILAVSQFTLYGDARKGRRPSFDDAAPAQAARGLFDKFVDRLSLSRLIIRVGRFQESMQVESVNDGPVTILLESPSGAADARFIASPSSAGYGPA
jgi:D-tyrosyl-tRNA(Tyr) deacylase